MQKTCKARLGVLNMSGARSLVSWIVNLGSNPRSIFLCIPLLRSLQGLEEYMLEQALEALCFSAIVYFKEPL